MFIADGAMGILKREDWFGSSKREDGMRWVTAIEDVGVIPVYIVKEGRVEVVVLVKLVLFFFEEGSDLGEFVEG